MVAQPTGPFPVSVCDFAYQAPNSVRTPETAIAGRIFYPSNGKGPRHCSWIKSYTYAKGYITFSFFGARGLKYWLIKSILKGAVFVAGSAYKLPVTWCDDVANTAPDGTAAQPFPVVIFSHGAAANRNTYSAICCELASQGLVVAAVEHADGSAGAVQLPGGAGWQLFTGLGKGRVLEQKCEYRLGECNTLVQLLGRLNEGETPPGFTLSGATDPGAVLKGRLSMQQVAVIGHSCGGATAALAASSCPRYKCAVALDPWWPLLPEGSPALTGWLTDVPLLVLGSHAWNTPDSVTGKLLCDGDTGRQRLVLAASGRTGVPPTARCLAGEGEAPYIPAAAAAAAAESGASGEHSARTAAGRGGGSLLLVLKGTGHNTCSDLPLLLEKPTFKALASLLNLKPPSIAPLEALHYLTWSMVLFLQQHLPWQPHGSVGASAPAVRGPGGLCTDTPGTEAGNGSAAGARRPSKEDAGSTAAAAAAAAEPPGDNMGAPVGGQQHIPLRPGDEVPYAQHFGDKAHIISLHVSER